MTQARQRQQAGARRARAAVRQAGGGIPAALLAAVALGIPGMAEEPVPAPLPAPPIDAAAGDQALGVAALLAAARTEAAADRFERARDLYQRALARDPANAAARAELAQLDAVIAGRNAPIIHEPADPVLRQQVALAEARMALDHAELMSRGGRNEDAVGLLAAARANLLPYQGDATIRAELQRMDALIQTCQEHSRDAAESAAAGQRSGDRDAAVARARAIATAQRDAFRERVSRIEALEERHHYELALAACRRLVTDYPSEVEAERLFTRLLARAHEQRRLTQGEQRSELGQEVMERIQRSMIPTGFDGNPIYPSDWADRHSEGGAFDAPTKLPAWHEALLERLDSRISYNFENQNAVDVLNALARQTNINLIIDPSIYAGGDKLVTLKANNITLEHTLAWVCRLIDARWHISKGAIYVGGDEDTQPLLSVYDISDLLFQPKDQAGKLLGLNGGGGAGGAGGGGGGFALFKNAAPEATTAITPEDLVDHIQKAVSPDTWTKPEYGITVRGSTLMVTAPPRIHLLIQQFIRSQSHVKNVLVRVEARWLTLEDGYLEEIGVNWTTTNGLLRLPGNPQPTDGYHRATNEFDHSGSLINNLPATAVNPNPATFGTGLTLQGTLVKATQLSAILTAVERNTRGTILESPTVTTISGVRSTCFFGREFAYISDYDVGGGGGQNGLSSTLDPKITVLNLGASLDIKPYVSSDGKYVTMEFRPALVTLESLFEETITVPRFFPTGFNGAGNGGIGAITGNVIAQGFTIEFPNVLVEEVGTNVIIPDDGTLLVGGFGHHVEQTTSTEIPFLGHIPYVGRLFGQRGRYSNRSQLYLLATVHIINYQELEAKL